MKIRIGKWGNSLGFRLPRRLTERPGLAPGQRVEVHAEGNRLVISRPCYTLDELLAACDPVAPLPRRDRTRSRPIGRELI